MADDADRATEYSELFLAVSLSNAQQNNHRLALRGTCHNCSENVAQNANFCDPDCRDDWQKRNHR